MNYRLIKISITLGLALLLGIGLLNMSACDPCHSCGGGTPTPTHTHKPTPTPTQAPNACLPSSSIGVLVQDTNVTAYVPQSDWEEDGTTGIAVVPIETSTGIAGKATGPAAAPSPSLITTPNFVNSCSSNSTTGLSVCVANNTDVYLLKGTSLGQTLTSGATGSQSFTGGDCENCGVVIDSTTNKALITMGLSAGDRTAGEIGLGGPGGFQFLDLEGTPTFESPIGAGTFTSEDVSIDPVRHLILSPVEGGFNSMSPNYQIVDVSLGTTSPVIYNQTLTDPIGDGDLDSAAEDCTTGIAIATDEFTGQLFLADLTQANFISGSPGTWSSTGQQFEEFPEFEEEFPGLSAGTCGAAVAPGTHLAIITGEFGGNIEGVVQLPSTSGHHTPAAADYVQFTMPTLPDESEWDQGFDPHPVTAYVSPNTGKSYAVLGNEEFSYLAVVDLQAVLNAPRSATHVASDPLPDGVVTYIPQQ
ncbi:MAG TPA: hypothetical protein VMU16_15830 [Candidatus Binataceae bacterium]|nr:hypothetical protein [Candidatus Binataceae bacterium]